MEFSIILILSVVLLIAGLFVILLIPAKFKAFIATVTVVSIGFLTSIPAVSALSGFVSEFNFSGLFFIGSVIIRIDSLSAWFILIINFTSVTGIIYGAGYMKAYSIQKTNLSLHWFYYILFHSSMIWVCMVQNSLVFLVVWEIMSISSLLLVLFDSTNSKTIKAGINYLVQMHVGVIFLTIAFIWVYISQGSYDFEAIGIFFSENPNIWLFLLFFIGFGIKAGFVPLHSWLPHAHPAAPSHISGVMSGVIVKLGIYGILRMVTYLKADFLHIGEIILILSVTTGIYGITNAAVHRDFKRMLAYCTIENIGIIGIGIGLGLIGLGKENNMLIILGFGGALLHVLNHSLFKSLLFYTVGSIYSRTHTRDMEKLGGLIKKMPQTSYIYLIGAIAICGLPPLNGFISEFIIYIGLLDGIQLAGFYHSTLFIGAFAGMAIIGGIALLAFTKNFGLIFLGSQRTQLEPTLKEVPIQMRISQYSIILVMLSIGLFPTVYFSKVFSIITNTISSDIAADYQLILPTLNLLSKIGFYSLLFIVLVILIYSIRYLLSDKKSIDYSPTWGCGYIAPKTSMQYTGKSFSKPFTKILGVFLPENKKYNELKSGEVFPETRKHASYHIDFFEHKILDKITKPMLNFMNIFQFVQNGKIQFYILYGLLFILLIFIGSLFNLI